MPESPFKARPCVCIFSSGCDWTDVAWDVAAAMDAYSRHLRLVHDYQKYYLKPGEVMFPPEPVGKTDKVLSDALIVFI